MSAADRGRISAEIFEIATMHGSVERRAQALLEPLAPLLRYDAAWISLLDPEHRAQRTVAITGYSERVRRFYNGAAFMAEMELIGLNARHRPIRAKDCPVPVADLEVWADYLEPAGFGEGLTTSLLTPDGRYLGILGSHNESSVPPSDEVSDELHRLAPLIAHAVDPMRGITALAGLVGDAAAGVVLTHGGRTEPLPGLPGDPLLDVDSPALANATALVGLHSHVTFLVPCDPEGTDLARITALTCPRNRPATTGPSCCCPRHPICTA